MPSDYSIFYKTLAEGMDYMLRSIGDNLDAINKVIELLPIFINLTTDVDFDANRAILDVGTVMKEEVYKGLITLPQYDRQVYPGVIALNEHTKRYINADLTDFVNNEVWNGACVPYEWSIASEATGEDISGWNVCDPS